MDDLKPTNEIDSADDLASAWESGEATTIAPPQEPKTSVLSIRLPQELLKELTAIARENDRPPTTFARELIEVALTLDYPVSGALITRVLGRLLENAAINVQPWTHVVHQPLSGSWWGSGKAFEMWPPSAVATPYMSFSPREEKTEATTSQVA